MAVKRGDDSKQGLIIALVFFVLLAIGLGVATYYGFEGQQALRDKLKKAETDTATFKKDRDWEQFQKLYLKASVGEAFSEAEKEKDTFADAMARYNNKQLGDDKQRAEFEPLFEKLKKALKWEGDQPKVNYLARVAELEAALRQKDELLAKTQEDTKAAQKKFDEDLAEIQKNYKKLNDELGRVNKLLADQTTKKSEEFDKALEQIKQAQVEVDKAKRDKEDLKDELTKTINKQTKTLKEKDTQIGKLNDQIKPPNVLDYDKPKGKIKSVERTGQTVYITLGSADNVKPQLTFSIYGVGPDGKPLAQRKGALEVANVLEGHLSRARITEMTDPNRDPALVGDLLFNPVWSPTLKTHVAIAGVIDLTGEGTDNTAEFIRGLERQGIIVDAWLDLKDLAIKGPGVSLKTNYLVLGDRPEFADVPTNATDRLTTDKTNLIKKMSEMQDEAIKLGVSVIPFRRFLAVIGYPLPRVLTTRSNASGYLDSLLLSTGAKRHEAEKEKGDKEDKDKGDKAAPKGKGKADKEEPKEKEK